MRRRVCGPTPGTASRARSTSFEDAGRLAVLDAALAAHPTDGLPVGKVLRMTSTTGGSKS